jgi:hypothetical protein
MMLKLFSVTLLFLIILMPLTEAQDSEYYQDAVQLSARLIVNETISEIPEHLIYSIEDALLAVSHSSFVSSNVVCHKYSIHTTKSTNTKNLKIIVGKEANWSTDLTKTPVHLIFPSLKVKETEETDAYFVYEISSEKEINMKFIASELSVINDIWMVELPSVSKTGNDIKLQKDEEGGFIITYSLKTGNCELGCNERHYWKFKVSASGEVSFHGEHGTDLTNSAKAEKDFFSLLDEQKP